MDNLKVLSNIRIRKVTLTDFRNIKHSEIEFPNGKAEDLIDGNPSILGLYGQNGSGKTSLLLAISALKAALSGDRFSVGEYGSCIRAGCDHARLEFELFAVNEEETEFVFYYSFSLGMEKRDNNKRVPFSEYDESLELFGFGNVFSDKGYDQISEAINPANKGIIIYDEILKYEIRNKTGEKSNRQVLINTSKGACFGPKKAFGNKTKYEQLTANCDADIDDFLYDAKVEAKHDSVSFIFSEKVVVKLYHGSSEELYRIILRSLSDFGNNHLFVIMTSETAFNSMRMLPLSLWIDGGEDGSGGFTYPLKLFDHSQAVEDIYPFLKDAIASISKVISTIVPGLGIEIEDSGSFHSKNGQEVHLFDLVSVRGDVRIPLAYESDGIRRIISILSLITAVYNNPSVTLAIDEIDSGIFEYMLGEILSVLGESAKGQLIFTSHNLRPLEVLPPKNLLFTTINPERRFAKLEGISGNNNLRDCYFRTIDLGVGKDAFYEATDTFSIEQAFYEVGHQEE